MINEHHAKGMVVIQEDFNKKVASDKIKIDALRKEIHENDERAFESAQRILKLENE
jgi:hypothetical protein